MGYEKLFIRTKRYIGNDTLKIQLDGVLSESHNSEIRLTSNPVELGADVTDNAIIEPRKLRLAAVVTDTPLGTAALGEIVNRANNLFGTSTTPNLTRSAVAYNSIIELQQMREPFDVQTKLLLYENMMIASVDVLQDKNSSRIVNLIINLQEIRIVSSQIVQLTPDQLAAGAPRDQGSSTDNRGQQAAQQIDENKKSSLLNTIIEWVRS